MKSLVVVFRSGGYLRGGYVYAATFRIDSSVRLNALETAEVAPVHGIPMRARETVLASMLRSGIYPPAETAAAASPSRWIRDYRAIRSRTGNAPLKLSAIKQAKEKLPKGTLLGIEIEHYPSPERFSQVTALEQSRGLTNATGDGSLRSGGMELRRLTWAGANGRLNGILGLAPLLSGATVDTRCGLHIHVDVRHLPAPGMGCPTEPQCDAGEVYDRLVSLYPLLKQVCPPSRRRSSYCRWRNNRRGSATFRADSQGNRYAAVNWDSYAEHGTIEFRCQGGSVNVTKIESWALLCQFLTRWVSIRDNSVPRSWDQLLAVLPRWLASWCVLRRERLYGDLGPVDERVRSAVDQSEGGEG